MKNKNHSTIVKRAAGVGLSVLLLSAAAGSVRAQNDRLGGSQPTVEPEKDASAGPPLTEGTEASKTPETVIRKWPEAARVTAREMIGKYGEPSRFSDGALVWVGNGPWAKTVVYRNAWPHRAFTRDRDYLEQTVAYRVPAEKVDDLRHFDRRVVVREGLGQLSSRSESEALNFLALNLADEIVMDKRSVEDARAFYRKTERLAESGKASPYSDGLMFSQTSDARTSTVEDPIDTDYDRNFTP